MHKVVSALWWTNCVIVALWHPGTRRGSWGGSGGPQEDEESFIFTTIQSIRNTWFGTTAPNCFTSISHIKTYDKGAKKTSVCVFWSENLHNESSRMWSVLPLLWSQWRLRFSTRARLHAEASSWTPLCTSAYGFALLPCTQTQAKRAYKHIFGLHVT